MPKLKKSATSAISSARRAARGVSIMVPMVTSRRRRDPFRACEMASVTQPRASTISSRLTVSGIMISITGLPPALARSSAASMSARTCMA